MRTQKKTCLLLAVILLISAISGVVLHFLIQEMYYNKYFKMTSEELEKMTKEEQLEVNLKKYEWIIKKRKMDDLKLTIYCSSYGLIKEYYDDTESIVYWCEFITNDSYNQDPEHLSMYILNVDEPKLKKHVKNLEQLTYKDIVPMDLAEDAIVDIDLYYVFEYDGKKLFDVGIDIGMWGYYKRYTESNYPDGPDKKAANFILIDGILVKEKKAFYNVIIPFLLTDYADMLEQYVAPGVE